MTTETSEAGTEGEVDPVVVPGTEATETADHRTVGDPPEPIVIDPAPMVIEPYEPPRVQIRDVEVFRVGTWNGLKYTAEDLADMVRNAPLVGFRPVVKLGHEAGGADPAYGYVENLRVSGERLVCDFDQVCSWLPDMIREGRYGSVSSEIFLDLKRDGKTYRRVLKGVAILGADVPGVADLKPLRDSTLITLSQQDAAGVAVHNLSRSEIHMTDNTQTPAGGNQATGGNQDVEARFAAMQQQLDAASTALNKASETIRAQSETITSLQGTQDEVRRLNQVMAEQAEQARLSQCDELAKSCKIPALRDHIRVFADLATKAGPTAVAKFSIEGKDVEIALPTAIRNFVDLVNKRAELLFEEKTQNLTAAQRRTVSPEGVPADQAYNDAAEEYAAKHKIPVGQAYSAIRKDPEYRDVVARYDEMAN